MSTDRLIALYDRDLLETAILLRLDGADARAVAERLVGEFGVLWPEAERLAGMAGFCIRRNIEI